jgi:hypothetical protein
MSEEMACREFMHNCRYTTLQDKLAHKKPKTVANLVSIATVYAYSDRTKDKSGDERRSKKSGKNPPNNNNTPKNNKRKSDDGGS